MRTLCGFYFILFYSHFCFFYKNDWCNCSVARKSFFYFIFFSKFIVNGNSLWICFSSVFVLCFLLTCYLWGYFYKYSHRLGKSKHNTLNKTIKVNCIFPCSHIVTLVIKYMCVPLSLRLELFGSYFYSTKRFFCLQLILHVSLAFVCFFMFLFKFFFLNWFRQSSKKNKQTFRHNRSIYTRRNTSRM